MTDIDLDDLRKKAEASADYGDDWYFEDELLMRLDGANVAVTDPRFIAAANPSTVLALIERVEEAERERDALAGKVRRVLLEIDRPEDDEIYVADDRYTLAVVRTERRIAHDIRQALDITEEVDGNE